MNNSFKARQIYIYGITILIVILSFIMSMHFSSISKEVGASKSNLYKMDIQNDWAKIKASIGNVEGLKLKSCDADFAVDGSINNLKFQLIEKSEIGQKLYDIIYNPDKNAYSIYSRRLLFSNNSHELIDAESFFSVFSSLRFNDIVSLGEYERCHIAASGEKNLLTDKDICTLELKDRKMVGISIPSSPSYSYQFLVSGIEEMTDAQPIEFNKISLIYNISE